MLSLFAIITLLLTDDNSPWSTNVTLEPRDITKNALLTIAQALQQIETITTLPNTTKQQVLQVK